jgi:hypothetical protein
MSSVIICLKSRESHHPRSRRGRSYDGCNAYEEYPEGREALAYLSRYVIF